MSLEWLFLRRVHVAVLVFVGLVTNYMLRVNLNLAIEFMTKKDNGGPYVEWSLEQKENIKGAFFIGYFIMQVPGGRLAEMFGTKRVFGYNMFVCAVLASLTPVLCVLEPTTSYPVMYGLRVLQGIVQGPCFPAMHPLTTRWVPEAERMRFVSFSYLGGTFGSVITFPLCGIIIKYTSWVWVFYSTAIVTFVWFVLWIVFFHDFPEDDPFISESEKKLIVSSRSFDPAQLAADRALPLLPLVCDMLKTPPVWVDMFADFANGVGIYVLLTEAPAFIKGLLPIGQNSDTLGYICAAPMLARCLFGFVCGPVSDFMITTGRLSRLNMQKVNAGLAFMVPAGGMIVMSFIATPDLQWACIAVLVTTFAFNGGAMSGHIQNIIGLAPNRSGTLYGLTNGFGNISGFLVPEIKKRIVLDESSLSQWRWMFVLASISYCAITTVFSVFASDSVQAFNYTSYVGVTTVNYFTSGKFLQIRERK